MTAITEERSAQSYVHECGDGGYLSMTFSDGPPGHVYPPQVCLGGECVLCGAEPLELRQVSPEYLAALDGEAEDDDAIRDPSAPDTSQPYPLDALVERINTAVGSQ